MNHRQQPRPADREATERALEEAALTLLEEEGVLAGLNLQRVADLAGANRGLVYHYYGSRRDLLRHALRRTASELQSGSGPFFALPLRDRAKTFFRAMVRNDRAARLVLLLAIDGDLMFRMTGDRDAARAAHARDVGTGDVAGDIDPAALDVVLASAVFAYAVRRRTFAREAGLGVRELDRRVEEVLVRMVDGLRSPLGGPRGGTAALAESPR